MNDYISREAAIDSLLGWAAQLTETYGKNDEYVRCLESAAYNIEQLPAADVRPVVRGRWKRGAFTDVAPKDIEFYYCSECGHRLQTYRTRFCPNCGARMEEQT